MATKQTASIRRAGPRSLSSNMPHLAVISTTNSQNTNYTSQNITSIYSNTEIVKIFTLSTPTSMSILTDKWSWSQIKF